MNATATALTREELDTLRALATAVDARLEESLRRHEGLRATLHGSAPLWLEHTRATGVVLRTLDEHGHPLTFAFGDFGSADPDRLLSSNPNVSEEGALFVAQSLDVAGAEVGAIGLYFSSADAASVTETWARLLLETLAEELDGILMLTRTAAEKQQLILDASKQLSQPVFEDGVDHAVALLASKLRLEHLTLVYRDVVETQVLRYRSYAHGTLIHDGVSSRNPQLEAAIAKEGRGLLDPDGPGIAEVLGHPRGVEVILASAGMAGEPLGKLSVAGASDAGLSSFAVDLIQVLAASLTQRLMDYNRERIHLSEYFSSRVIDRLLAEPDYARNHLGPKVREVAILFADINGFTRICEQVLISPERIGHFVDRWSDRAVEVLFDHGGTFDKMVGDCVIGLFGPPFFERSRVELVEAAVRTALALQEVTAEMSAEPELKGLEAATGNPGLGIAIGINLAPTCCGAFGHNQDYTGFSSGMNQTARLQSLGKFRETLLMRPVQEALAESADPSIRKLSFGPLTRTEVKNVAQPLEYVKVLAPS